jgi:hypothetical protein
VPPVYLRVERLRVGYRRCRGSLRYYQPLAGLLKGADVEVEWANLGGPSRPCYLPGEPIPEGFDWEMWLGRSLKYDPVKEEILGDPEAARWLDRPKRAPWHV